jgi:hypothetical protein
MCCNKGARVRLEPADRHLFEIFNPHLDLDYLLSDGVDNSVINHAWQLSLSVDFSFVVSND